jgi:hypothetical protein
MSLDAIAWVYRHSPYRGATFAVHLAVADSVNDQYKNELWMEQGKLAAKARVGRQAVNAALSTLTAEGFIRDLGPVSGQNRVRRFRFRYPDVPVVYESRFHDPDEVVASDDNQPDEVVAVDDNRADQVVASDDSGCRQGRQQLSSTATHNPREPNTTQTEGSSDDGPATTESDPYSFTAFWARYPRRNGKKLGRADALAQWQRLKPTEIPAVMTGVEHYAAACNGLPWGTFAKDAFRWLRGRCWLDWQEPATFDIQPGRRGPSTLDAVKAVADREGLL